MNRKFVVVEGNIGAGKTSLAQKLSAETQATLILETFENNPFLAAFYENPAQNALQLELSFLAQRVGQCEQILANGHRAVVADYYFPKSLIFAQANLSETDFYLYQQIFNIAYKSIPKPDLYVYLHLESEQLCKNINQRGRAIEKNIKQEYLQKIQNAYFRYLNQITDFKILIIDTAGIDFVNRPADYRQIKSAIYDRQYENGVTRLQL